MIFLIFISSALAMEYWPVGPDAFARQDFKDCADEVRADFQSGVVTLARLHEASDDVLACRQVLDEARRMSEQILEDAQTRREELQARIIKKTPSLSRLVASAPSMYDPWTTEQLDRAGVTEITSDLDELAETNSRITWITQRLGEIRRLDEEAEVEFARYQAVAQTMVDQVCAGKITIPEQPLPEGTCESTSIHRIGTGIRRPIR
ncbi:MAG: hypothetical protein WC654_02735 [Patescibacteria group bacterium]